MLYKLLFMISWYNAFFQWYLYVACCQLPQKIIRIIPPFLKKHIKELFLIIVAIGLIWASKKNTHDTLETMKYGTVFEIFFQCMLHIFLFHQLCNIVQCPDLFNRNYTIHSFILRPRDLPVQLLSALCFNYKHIELEGSSEQRIGLNQSPVTRLQLSPCPEHCGRTICGHPGVSKGPV